MTQNSDTSATPPIYIQRNGKIVGIGKPSSTTETAKMKELRKEFERAVQIQGKYTIERYSEADDALYINQDVRCMWAGWKLAKGIY